MFMKIFRKSKSLFTEKTKEEKTFKGERKSIKILGKTAQSSIQMLMEHRK